ncbi:hypothetical protein WIV_gp041 [Wiseana iridescent virus]|uniref:Uncharacterized protein n=1 Tax=Wiseana iridescent virus TaxID=68347 RepID=G0T567_IRV9|nr:hypothetical protein WIV_gp041 [Wiseana iridescent virus]ADO00384.1 hypothetical protein [Wiseana iridescent virus]
MDYVTKVNKFPEFHPMGNLSGTHLHDYDLNVVKDREGNNQLIIGDCFGYFGASGWWYLYNNDDVIQMHDKRVDMEEDKKELDEYRRQGVPFKKIIEIYKVSKTTNKKYWLYAKTSEDYEEEYHQQNLIDNLKSTTTLESTIQKYNMLASKLDLKVYKQLKQFLVELSLKYKKKLNNNNYQNYTSSEDIHKIFNECLNHPPTELSEYLESVVSGYGGNCSEFNEDLKHPLCSLYTQNNYFKDRTLYCITDPLCNIKQIGNGMVTNMGNFNHEVQEKFNDLINQLSKD